MDLHVTIKSPSGEVVWAGVVDSADVRILDEGCIDVNLPPEAADALSGLDPIDTDVPGFRRNAWGRARKGS